MLIIKHLSQACKQLIPDAGTGQLPATCLIGPGSAPRELRNFYLVGSSFWTVSLISPTRIEKLLSRWGEFWDSYLIDPMKYKKLLTRGAECMNLRFSDPTRNKSRTSRGTASLAHPRQPASLAHPRQPASLAHSDSLQASHIPTACSRAPKQPTKRTHHNRSRP